VKITLSNKTNKPRSKKSRQELKDFAKYMAEELGITQSIKVIRLTYKKDFNGYYPKGKPLAGFFKLWNNGVVTIDLARHWDRSQEDRKTAIVHELTHVKQMISKQLVVYKNAKQVKWKGKYATQWKTFRDSIFDELTPDKQDLYVRICFPWEAQVQANCDKYQDMIQQGKAL